MICGGVNVCDIWCVNVCDIWCVNECDVWCECLPISDRPYTIFHRQSPLSVKQGTINLPLFRVWQHSVLYTTYQQGTINIPLSRVWQHSILYTTYQQGTINLPLSRVWQHFVLYMTYQAGSYQPIILQGLATFCLYYIPSRELLAYHSAGSGNILFYRQ